MDTEKAIDVALYDMPFMDVLELAEALGWQEPPGFDEWDASAADEIQADAIDFIKRASNKRQEVK